MSIHIRTVHITTASLIDSRSSAWWRRRTGIYASDENEPNLSAIPQGIPARELPSQPIHVQRLVVLREGSVRALCRITLGRS